MADLEVWKDYVTVINAARLNAMRDQITTNEGNISYHQTLINANTTDIYKLSTSIDNLSSLQDDYLKLDGSRAMISDLNMNGEAIKNIEYLSSVNGSHLYLFAFDSGGLIKSSLVLNASERQVHPNYDNTHELGTSTKRWSNFHCINIFGKYYKSDAEIQFLPYNTTLCIFEQNALDMMEHKITNLQLPSSNGDATNKSYVDTIRDNMSSNIYNISQTYFRRDGTFSMTGNILLGLGKALILDDDSDTYLWGGYLDDNVQLWAGNSLVLSADSSKVTLAKTLDVGNHRIQNLTTPSTSTDAVNKQYVDDQVVGTIQLMPIYFRNITNHEYLIGGGTGDTKFMWGASVTAVKYTITGNFTGPGRIDIGFYYGETADSGDDYSFTSGAAGGFKGVRSLNVSLSDLHGINVKVYNISNLNYATWTLKWHYN